MPDFLSDLNAFRLDLEANGLLPDECWRAATITGVIQIDAAGDVIDAKKLAPTRTIRELLPRLPDRTSAPVPSFLLGSGEYWAGRHRNLQRELHERVLADVDDIGAKAVLAFMRRVDLPSLPASVSLFALQIIWHISILAAPGGP